MLRQDRRNWFSEFSRQIFARAEMIYSCLENKTDAKYEILIFEHFHSPGYRGMIERGKRNISQMAFFHKYFSQRQIPPAIFWCIGGMGAMCVGLWDAGMWHCHCFSLPSYMCLSPRPAPRVLFLGRQPKLGLSPSRASPSENLISSSTSSGKALVTTELDVLVCNTFSSRTNRDAS